MLRDHAKPNWTLRIASVAVALAVASWLTLGDKADGKTGHAPALAATSCKSFETDAVAQLDRRDSAVLNGKFAPGDHVHLAIDIVGLGYSWELSGVLAKSKVADAHSDGSFGVFRLSAGMATVDGAKVARGHISGYTTLELNIDVTAAGDGAITINKGDSIALAPRVVAASCGASKKAHPLQQSASNDKAAVRAQ